MISFAQLIQKFECANRIAESDLHAARLALKLVQRAAERSDRLQRASVESLGDCFERYWKKSERLQDQFAYATAGVNDQGARLREGSVLASLGQAWLAQNGLDKMARLERLFDMADVDIESPQTVAFAVMRAARCTDAMRELLNRLVVTVKQLRKLEKRALQEEADMSESNEVADEDLCDTPAARKFRQAQQQVVLLFRHMFGEMRKDSFFQQDQSCGGEEANIQREADVEECVSNGLNHVPDNEESTSADNRKRRRIE